MRHDKFGTAYCHTHADLVEVLDDKGIVADLDVFAELMADEDTPGTFSAEIKFNEDGETVCWLEGYKSDSELVLDLNAVGIANKNIIRL